MHTNKYIQIWHWHNKRKISSDVSQGPEDYDFLLTCPVKSHWCKILIMPLLPSTMISYKINSHRFRQHLSLEQWHDRWNAKVRTADSQMMSPEFMAYIHIAWSPYPYLSRLNNLGGVLCHHYRRYVALPDNYSMQNTFMFKLKWKHLSRLTMTSEGMDDRKREQSGFSGLKNDNDSSNYW